MSIGQKENWWYGLDPIEDGRDIHEKLIHIQGKCSHTLTGSPII